MKSVKIKPAILKRSGFILNKWGDDGVVYEEYVIENEHVRIEVYGETPEVDMSINGEWIAVPNCKTEEDLSALLKLFGFTGKYN